MYLGFFGLYVGFNAMVLDTALTPRTTRFVGRQCCQQRIQIFIFFVLVAFFIRFLAATQCSDFELSPNALMSLSIVGKHFFKNNSSSIACKPRL